MTERQPGGESGPGTGSDIGGASGGAPAEGLLRTAAEVAAARLAAETEGQAVAPRAGGVADMIRRHPSASVLIGLGVGLGVGWLADATAGSSPASGGCEDVGNDRITPVISLPRTTSRSACANAAAVGKRSSRFFASALSRTSWKPFGKSTPGARSASGIGGWLMCMLM